MHSRDFVPPLDPGGAGHPGHDELSRLTNRLRRERHARLESEQISERAIRHLYERKAELDLLKTVATAANEASAIEEVMQITLDRVCAHTGWPVGHVYLRARNSTDELIPTTIWHLDDPVRFEEFRRVTEDTRFQAGVGLPGRVLADRVPAWIIDVRNDPNFPRARAAVAVGLQAAFAFPVPVNGTVGTVLEFFSPESAEPNEPLLELMSHVGTQIGRVVERKQAEERLKDSERRLAMAQQIAHIGSWEWDIAHDHITWSEELYRIFGLTPDELQPTFEGVMEQIHPDDREQVTRAVERTLDTHEPYDHHHRVLRPDGSVRMLHARGQVTVDHEGRPVKMAGISQDVTEQREVEARLAANEEIERANQAKSEFLSRMSHELRTPLNSILGFGQLLELADLDPEQRDNVHQMLRGGRHLLELINEVLDISRIEAGNMAISLEPVHIGSTLDRVLDLVEPLASERSVSLTRPSPDDADRYVLADQQRLTQVLLNLVSNGIKYNRPEGSVTVSLEDCGATELFILVTDTGKGIPEDKLTQVFSPFERLGAEQSAIEGTGLGLTLSKLLVEAMGGTLGVESEPWVGTTFLVKLASAEAPAEAPELEDPDLPGRALDASPTESRTILYVEDNPSNFKLVKQIFAGRPEVKLLAAMEGNMAVEVARMHRPDLILLDLHLPGISGEEVLERLRNEAGTKDIPVIVISADATPGRVNRLLEAGANAYLTKPLDVRRFLAVVEEVLRDGVVLTEELSSHRQ